MTGSPLVAQCIPSGFPHGEELPISIWGNGERIDENHRTRPVGLSCVLPPDVIESRVRGKGHPAAGEIRLRYGCLEGTCRGVASYVDEPELGVRCQALMQRRIQIGIAAVEKVPSPLPSHDEILISPGWDLEEVDQGYRL